MKNHKKVILIIVVILLIIVGGVVIGGKLFLTQYNKDGISRSINITINREIDMEYVGESETYKVYTYQLEEPYCMDIYAKKYLLSEVLEEKKITVTDMVKGLHKVKNKKTEIVYEAENYQVILQDEKCIITPLENDIE